MAGISTRGFYSFLKLAVAPVPCRPEVADIFGRETSKKKSHSLLGDTSTTPSCSRHNLATGQAASISNLGGVATATEMAMKSDSGLDGTLK